MYFRNPELRTPFIAASNKQAPFEQSHSCHVVVILTYHSRDFIYFYCFQMFIYFWEREKRERERERAHEWGGAEIERERETERQKIGSRLLSCQHKAWRGAPTGKSWGHDLSWSQRLNQLSHRGALVVLTCSIAFVSSYRNSINSEEVRPWSWAHWAETCSDTLGPWPTAFPSWFVIRYIESK